MGSQALKFRTIKWFIARDGSELSPLERTRKLVGIGRTHASALNTGIDALKSKDKRERLDQVYEDYVPRPGDLSYRALHADVQKKLESQSKDDIQLLHRYIIPLAFSKWASIALDPRGTASERLKFGATSQRALFDWCYKLPKKRKDFCEDGVNEPDDFLVERGRAVIETLVELLGAYRDPPADLFPDTASPSAKMAGYRMFRTAILNDHMGWYGCGPFSEDHAQRAETYAKGYKSGLADDLMWLYSLAPDVAHPNNSWNMAMHAGDWAESVRFAAVLLKDYPELLHSDVKGLPPICKDETVWPGVAAMVNDTRFHELDGIRESLNSERYAKMMTAVRPMTERVRQNQSYVEVLNMEKGS